MWCWSCGWTLVASLWLADEPALTLQWHGAPGCPDAVVVRERLEGVVANATGTIRIVAHVGRDAERWRLTLDVHGPAGEGTRELEAESCDALVESMVVVVGIAARDTTGVPTPPAPVAPEEPHVAPPSEPEASAPPIAIPRSPPPVRSIGWGVRVGGGVDVGLLPGYGGTLRAGTGPSWRRAMIEVGVVHGLSRVHEHGDLSGSFWLTAGSVRGGPVLRRRALVLAGLFGVEVGVVRGKGGGVPTRFVADRPWMAAEGAVDLGWRFARSWILAVDASLAVPLLRWDYAIGDVKIASLGRIGGRFGVAIRWERLPTLRIPARGGQH